MKNSRNRISETCRTKTILEPCRIDSYIEDFENTKQNLLKLKKKQENLSSPQKFLKFLKLQNISHNQKPFKHRKQT
jgi:hypothetical protein